MIYMEIMYALYNNIDVHFVLIFDAEYLYLKYITDE